MCCKAALYPRNGGCSRPLLPAIGEAVVQTRNNGQMQPGGALIGKPICNEEDLSVGKVGSNQLQGSSRENEETTGHAVADSL